MNKLNVIWCLTSAANVILGLLLLFNGYYVRYSWLFFSCVFSVIVDMFGYFALTRDSAHYDLIFRLVYLAMIGINILIIWESFKLNDLRVRVPIEIELGMELVTFLAVKTEFHMAAYDMQCGLRVVNLLVIFWLIWIFRKEPFYETP